jgi:Holliday junction resolvase
MLLVFMPYYRKGANAERELIHILFKKGLAVLRVAGSGTSSLPCPDVVAMKPGLQLAIECKAWSKAYLSISNAQMAELRSWAKKAGTDFYVAWKIPRKGWRFLKPMQFNKGKKGYNISMKKALSHGIDLNVVIGEQHRLND